MTVTEKDGQLLHLVFGGELDDLQGVTFRDLDEVDIVGLFPNYASAYKAWKSQGSGYCRQCPHTIFYCPSAQNS